MGLGQGAGDRLEVVADPQGPARVETLQLFGLEPGAIQGRLEMGDETHPASVIAFRLQPAAPNSDELSSLINPDDNGHLGLQPCELVE